MSWQISGESSFQPNFYTFMRYCYCQNVIGSVEFGFLYRGDKVDSNGLEKVFIAQKKQGEPKVCLYLERDEEGFYRKEIDLDGFGVDLRGEEEDFFKTAREIVHMCLSHNISLYLLLRSTLNQAERAPYLDRMSALEEAL
jgi:hypothetical protein